MLGGVPKHAFFQRGARVMVTRNKLVLAGLVNGLCGWLWDIAWADGEPEAGRDGSLPMPDVMMLLVRADEVAVASFSPAPPGWNRW